MSTLFNDKVEGEIKTHEKEELSKALQKKLKKVAKLPLADRIKYISENNHVHKFISTQDNNLTAEEMIDALTKTGLLGSSTHDDIKRLMTSK